MIRYSHHALILSGCYLLLGLLYILVSGHFATMIAPGFMELANIEKTKGILFIIVTAIAIYWFGSWQLRAITREASELLEHRDVLLASERRTLTGTFAVAGAYDLILKTNSALAALDRLERTSLPVESRKVARELASELTGLQSKMQRVRDGGLELIAGERQQLDLCKALASSIEIAQLHGAVRGCDVRFTGCQSIRVWAFPSLIHAMTVSLILNAAQSTQGKGKIEVHVRVDDEGLTIEVHDNGPGIPAADRRLVFEPFYSANGRVIGMELAAATACVEAHGGRVDLFSSHLGGTRFDVVFPVSVLVQ
ncbi:MAG: hypothetical protein A2X94_00375 [Bdellovibrionales bacterium GWB1_55_8]|nr:MAG: hypothetical protein A2X94_00375 [Bdellovibrionales bacterium GWB1_55_8]